VVEVKIPAVSVVTVVKSSVPVPILPLSEAFVE